MDEIVTNTATTATGTTEAPVNRQGFEQDIKPPPFKEVSFGSDDEAEARIAAAMAGEEWDGGAGGQQDPQNGGDPTSGNAAPGAPGDGLAATEGEKPIEAPAHWPADQAEHWKTLPRSVQEAIAKPAAPAALDLNAHPEAQAELTQFRAQRDQQHQAVTSLVKALQAQFQGDELSKMTQEQWAQLSQTDPARYVALQHTMQERAALMRNALGAQQQLERQMQADQAAQHQRHLQEQAALMEKHHPDFVGEKGKALRVEARDYLKTAGFSAEEIDQLADHRLIGVIKDAMRGRKAASAADIAAKKVASAPPVARPTASAQSNPGLAKANAINAMRNATSTDEQAALLERYL